MKKKIIGITGSSGFLAQHLVAFFVAQSKRFKIIPFVGNTLKQKQVEHFVRKCDLVIHLAAKNRTHTDQEILQTNINGTVNVINACYSHKKGFLTCVERTLADDAFSISKNIQRSIVREYNKLGFQGFLMKLDPVLGGRECAESLKRDGSVFIEVHKPEDVCRWIYSFCDAYLTNGVFYVKEFEFWDPIRRTVKDLRCLDEQKAV